MTEWFSNGAAVDALPVDDRAIQYGDGVFETIAIRDARPRYWELHLDRLTHACRRLMLPMPTAGELERDVGEALAQSAVDTHFATAKIIVSAGTGPRGYARPVRGRPTTLVGVSPNRPPDRSVYENGVVTRLCETRIASQPRTAGIKTLNRLDQVLARAEWDDPDVFEGLMCDGENRLVCGTMSNLFIVRGSRLATPSLRRSGVAGIMRRRILDLLAGNRIGCEERDISRNELDDVEEVFICNSQFGAIPVRRLDDRRFEAGEATRSVMAMLADDEVPECRA